MEDVGTQSSSASDLLCALDSQMCSGQEKALSPIQGSPRAPHAHSQSCYLPLQEEGQEQPREPSGVKGSSLQAAWERCPPVSLLPDLPGDFVGSARSEGRACVSEAWP